MPTHDYDERVRRRRYSSSVSPDAERNRPRGPKHRVKDERSGSRSRSYRIDDSRSPHRRPRRSRSRSPYSSHDRRKREALRSRSPKRRRRSASTSSEDTRRHRHRSRRHHHDSRDRSRDHRRRRRGRERSSDSLSISPTHRRPAHSPPPHKKAQKPANSSSHGAISPPPPPSSSLTKRSSRPLPSQQAAYTSTTTTTALTKPQPSSPPPPSKQKPNYAPTGLLAAETNASAQNPSITLKYHEPPESRLPSTPHLLYVFKSAALLSTLQLHERSCWLFGREKQVVDAVIEHPSCSKQHAVLQFRHVVGNKQVGGKKGGGQVRLYVIDLESANGTWVNGDRVAPARYVEVRHKDVLRWGESEREYVLLVPSVEEEGMVG